jgi:formylglycine-generating enzyme required for sulfatase activity
MISWEDCQIFISKLNELTGEVFSLPTEAQWEYAARGGKQSTGSKYAGSNSIDNVAWYNENSSKVGMTHPDYGPHSVKTKAPNELGIYDMTGNVFEWCADWYGNYPENAVTNPAGPGTGDTRVTRGGGWQTLPERSCVYSRYSLFATSKGEGYGLRLVLNSPKK